MGDSDVTQKYSFNFGVIVGIILIILLGSLVFQVTGWADTIRLAKTVKEELRTGYNGVEEALGIARGTIKSVDDLIRITEQERTAYSQLEGTITELESSLERERETVEIIRSAYQQANNAAREIGAILESGNDILDQLIKWATDHGY